MTSTSKIDAELLWAAFLENAEDNATLTAAITVLSQAGAYSDDDRIEIDELIANIKKSQNILTTQFGVVTGFVPIQVRELGTNGGVISWSLSAKE